MRSVGFAEVFACNGYLVKVCLMQKLLQVPFFVVMHIHFVCAAAIGFEARLVVIALNATEIRYAAGKQDLRSIGN